MGKRNWRGNRGQSRNQARAEREAAEERIAEMTEWVEHRYDPGHYTGGKMYPLLTSRRPNKYGYVLGAGGLVLVVCMCLFSLDYWPAMIIPLGLAVLSVAAGVKLITPEHRKRRGKRGKGRQG